ncbi:MAG: hypothetical protein F6K53_01025 [Moorea sp. SIO4A1]|uniref:hypothetical protein n=1 Tax=Moorena sp. SIO4A1 TaxID=2607835 RepID=UPI00144D8620|nr:hypothetical protein [Moorena sp. SIO4A1]NEQ56058.1 hypothetical protein [Moorena sp. SIO4A1]
MPVPQRARCPFHNGQDARSTTGKMPVPQRARCPFHNGQDADSTGLILGWAVLTKVLCKLDYLSDPLPTLLLSAENRQARRILGWAVLTKVLCKLDYLSDPLPTLLLSAENRLF